MTKTGRKRGVVVSLIRDVANRSRRFTLDALCPPLENKQAGDNCRFLVKRGELAVMRPGKPGRWGGIVRAIYVRGKKL